LSCSSADEFWDNFEQNVAAKRIRHQMLNSDNPYEYEVDWPTKFWSNATIAYLKSSNNAEILPNNIEVEWIDYTDCDRNKCKHPYLDWDSRDPELYICIYCGTILHIKILKN
jgi:hypothetical protein